MSLAIMFSVLLGLLVFGVPIAYAIGSSGIVYMLLTQPSFLMSLPQRIWSGTNSFIIIAMPLFMITGELMNHSGLTKRLINFALLLVRPFKGGLAEVNIVASMIFGGITGSSVADTSAIGSILIPDMIKKGYSREFSTGVTVASSTMGMIIPPSIPMLMYSMVSGASVGKLFLAGVIPGLLVGITQLVYTYIISKKRHYPQEKGMLPLKETLSIAKDGSLAVLMPLIIIVSVSAGIATASESAGIALLYAMLLGFFVYKELKVKAVIQSLKKTAVMTSSIMIIGGFTMIFTWVLAIEQVPAAIASFLLDSNIPFWLILLLLDLLILFLGTFLDVVPCILLIAPILLPVMRTLGMEELQFGIIMIVGLAIGLVTPPVGMCLNVGSKISGLSILEIFKDSLPFLVCNVLVLLLVTFVPSVSLLLPSLI
ncbi:MAG: TRAP transporter large permease [Sphaerochaeta associata]|uniref:TRAP transporter large permease n=1 Tax=Sphaerochaeta associata TaxID=1129264 RepID=UPI002B20B6A5|nr:TRAP transporter large permease [Sphaerochaeta associata]MEA5028491.1 TRAP transporter large permease [Sphaerochaeta associata]